MRMLASVLLLSVGLPVMAQNDPSKMAKVGTVDARFQSYNVEMVEVIGGRFWKPYASSGGAPKSAAAGAPAGLDPNLFEQRTPIDLTNARLRKLAAALGPAYLRVSGTWANTVFFADSGADAGAPPATPPEGFGGVLTRAQWQGVVEFSKAVDGRIVTSMSAGAGTRDKDGVWTPVQAKKLVDATHAMGGKIAAAEFINEPTFPSVAGVPQGYDGAAFGRDFGVFREFLRKAAPEALVLGPGSVGEGVDLSGPGAMAMKMLPSTELLKDMGPVDAFSYHFYGGTSERCGATTRPEAALSEDWLSRTTTVEEFYAALRDKYEPGKPMWLTETGQTACGGDRWASTFLDSFRYLDQLGRLARLKVQTVMHNTLAASDYGLIDEKTLTPRPNYWAALLWHNTMGTTVLDAGAAPAKDVALYAHCLKGAPGGVALLALNFSRTESRTIAVPEASQRYTLTAADLMGRSVQLNGKELAVAGDGSVPKLAGVAAGKGDVMLPPVSISVFAVAGAGNPACR